MNRHIFTVLAQLNRRLLPSLTQQRLDPARLKPWQKALLAWRYYVTCRALG